MVVNVKARLWVDAYRRNVELRGGQVVIARHGDDSAGQIFLHIFVHGGREALLAPYTAMTGERRWRIVRNLHDAARTLEDRASEVETILRREVDRDPDCWIIDVETRSPEHYLTEPVDGELEDLSA